MHILLIDDDAELCELLTEYLQQEGFAVSSCHDAPSGLSFALGQEPSFIILDVMLPGFSGFDLLSQLRRKSSVPVLMLTARGEEVDRIVGLEMGADDYLAKPFNPRELVARIRAIRRRGATAAATNWSGPQRLVAGDILLDTGTRSVQRNQMAIALTSAEFSLLQALLSKLGQVVRRQDLVREVLGREFEMFDRSIDVHISSLRRKLGRHADGSERIKTVRSVGYQYVSSQAE